MKSLFAIVALMALFDPAEPTANQKFLVSGNWSELKRGWNTLVLRVTDADQQPVPGAAVSVAYEMVGMPMNPPQNPVIDKGDGIYEKRIFLGMRGEWRFDTTIQLDESSDTHARVEDVQ